MTLRHKEITTHLRKRIHLYGIAAKCRGYVSCGVQYITVNPVAYELEFTEQEQRQILIIAKANHLTLSRGKEIDTDQMTYSKNATFEFRP